MTIGTMTKLPACWPGTMMTLTDRKQEEDMALVLFPINPLASVL